MSNGSAQNTNMDQRQLQILFDHNDDVSLLCQKIIDLEYAVERLEKQLSERDDEILALQTELNDCEEGGYDNENIS